MSRRARTLVVVTLAAAAAATVAVGGAVLQAGSDEGATGEAHAPREPPALQLNVFASGAEARALRAGERAYETGKPETARRRFQAILRRDPTSIEAAIGAAVAMWPNGTTDRLREIVAAHPASGVARLHLGLALLAEGDAEAAKEEWRQAEARDPDSAAALEAETLLHPEMPRGRPYFVPSAREPAKIARLPIDERLALLRNRTRSGDAATWIAYGAALQQAGRPVSARVAFDRAAAVAPENVEARAAAAVARFDKDDPSAAFSRLGPLARAHPRSPVVRFHLGYLLLWLRQVEEAKRQLGLAARANGRDVHAGEARRLLGRLEGK